MAERFWPAHPLDEGIADGHSSFYFGPTGMVWSIDYLQRVGATDSRFDLRPCLPRLMDVNRAELPDYEDYAAHGSLLFGDLGPALLVMCLDPTPAIADLIYARAAANTTLPPGIHRRNARSRSASGNGRTRTGIVMPALGDKPR